MATALRLVRPVCPDDVSAGHRKGRSPHPSTGLPPAQTHSWSPSTPRLAHCTRIRCSFAGKDFGGQFGGQSRSQPSLLGISTTSSSNSSPYLPFRKPPPATSTTSLSVEELLEILRERRGQWYEFAPHITSLLNQGFSPSQIAEATGIQGGEQSVMVVGAQVYDTLKEMGCTCLDYFDMGGSEILYEIRILPESRRKAAAEYIAERRMDGKGARDLARAIKEHERRKREEGQGTFSPSPGDCMAYAFYRQGNEARSLSEKVANLEKALAHASTEAAAKTVQEALEETISPKKRAPNVDAAAIRVPIVRLRSDETFPKPLPVLGSMVDLNASAFRERVAGVGVEERKGPFVMFVPSPGSVWMAVPSWPAVAAAAGTVAGLIVDDPDVIPSLRGKKVQGPLMLVVEAGGEGEVGASNLFVVEDGDKLSVAGDSSENLKLGRVLVAVLPPRPEDEMEDFDLED